MYLVKYTIKTTGKRIFQETTGKRIFQENIKTNKHYFIYFVFVLETMCGENERPLVLMVLILHNYTSNSTIKTKKTFYGI